MRAPRRLREGFVHGLRELLSMERPAGTINLASGVPDPATIPDGTLERMTQNALKRDPRRLIEYGGPAGLPELREAIASRTGVEGNHVLVTNGSQQAVSLLSCWALEEGRDVLCETPTFTGIPGAFILMGNRVESIPWNEGALDLARAPRGRSLLYVCPEHHNPTGQTMNLAGRQALAAYAAQNDCVVVVDEIFRDLRFRGEALPSLYSLLPPGKRVLVGSISKTFMTGLRIGHIVADRSLVTDLMPYKRYLDLGGPSLTQAVAAAFLADGYDAHLDRVRPYYRERADATIQALEREMPSGVTFTRPEGGFQMWVVLPDGASAIQLYLRALERGVAISPGPAHDIDGRYANCFRIGYGHATPAVLRDAVARLATIVKECSLAEASASLGIAP
jgi:2-aminoadipate transaminase